MNYPLLDAFLTMLWFFLAVLWFFLLFRVIADVFRDDELSGWGKAGWLLFVVVFPFLGVLAYLVVRGRSMGAREVNKAIAQQDAVDSYIRQVATTPSPSRADEVAKLTDLRARGVLTEDEYQQSKARVLAA